MGVFNPTRRSIGEIKSVDLPYVERIADEKQRETFKKAIDLELAYRKDPNNEEVATEREQVLRNECGLIPTEHGEVWKVSPHPYGRL